MRQDCPRFDASIAKEIEAQLINLIDSGCLKLLCDFSETEYISSAGLRVLLVAAKKIQQNNGRVALCSLGTYVYEVFETSGFTKLFEIFGSEQEAVSALQ